MSRQLVIVFRKSIPSNVLVDLSIKAYFARAEVLGPGPLSPLLHQHSTRLSAFYYLGNYLDARLAIEHVFPFRFTVELVWGCCYHKYGIHRSAGHSACPFLAHSCLA